MKDELDERIMTDFFASTWKTYRYLSEDIAEDEKLKKKKKNVS